MDLYPPEPEKSPTFSFDTGPREIRPPLLMYLTRFHIRTDEQCIKSISDVKNGLAVLIISLPDA